MFWKKGKFWLGPSDESFNFKTSFKAWSNFMKRTYIINITIKAEMLL